MGSPRSEAPSRRGDSNGPLFVVGMPRSGTKLMRALLNEHPRISLTLAESHFIPYFVRTFGNPPRFSSAADLEPLVVRFLRTPFFRKMQAAGYHFDRDDQAHFLRSVDPTSWSSIFEDLLRRFGAKPASRDTIWGDKTPGYVNHIPLLRELFPSAKIIHMIRDPRDYCLSVRKSFGKSLYRAAERWRETVSRACAEGRMSPADYLEIHYEALLEGPEGVLRTVVRFLGCPYERRMLELETSHEDLGDATGRSGVVRDNAGKYAAELVPEEVRRIEGIVCEVAPSVGYVLENDVGYTPLGRMNLHMLHLYDGYASLLHHARQQGTMAKGLRSFLNHYRKSSWRRGGIHRRAAR